jgi:predicted Zn-dependent protease
MVIGTVTRNLAVRRRGTALRLLLAVLLPVVLAACDGAEEREAAYFERGKALYEAGDYRKASLELKNARQINPLNVDALYYLGLIAEKENGYREALGSYQSVLDQKPNHVGANLHLGRIQLMSGDVAKASEKATAALAVEPDNIEARALRGAVHLRNDRLDEARADAEFALAKDPANVAATSVLVGVLQKQDKAGEAIALLRKTTAGNKQETALRLLLIELYRREKDINGIETVYRELFEAEPKNLLYRTDLARFFVAFGDKDKAETLLREMVAQMPDNDRAKLVLIDFLTNQRSAEQAEGALKAFIKTNPGNAELRFGLTQLYIQDGRLDAAEAVLREVESASLSKSVTLRARTTLARLRLQQGDLESAGAMAKQVLTDEPGNPDALIMRARLNLRDGKRDEAIADLRHVLRDGPGNPEALALLADAHLRGGDIDLAVENLRLLLNSEPRNEEARLTLARIYVRQGKLDRAATMVDQVLDQSPKTPEALRLREDILLAQRKLQPAMETAKRMLNIEGEKSHGYVSMGRVYQAEGKHVEALDAFRRGFAEDPASTLALTGIVQSHLALKQGDEAVILLKRLISDSPKNGYVHNLLGEVYAYEKVAAKAAESFNVATELRKDWTLPYLNLSRLMVAERKPEQAVAVLKRGLENVPGDATLRLTLASAQQSSKDIDGAIATYRSVLDSNPRLDVAANNLAALVADFKYKSQTELDAALQLAQRFQSSENPYYLDTLGWLHYRKGDYSLAVVFLRKARDAKPDHPQLNLHLGLAYYKAGNTAEAKRYLEQAIALGDDNPDIVAEAQATLKAL